MNSNENNLLHCQGTDGKVLDKYLAESTACNESSTAASSCRELSNSAVSNMALATQASTLYTLRSRSERNVGDTLNCSGTSGCTPLVNKLSTASSGHRAARYWHSSCPTARELTPPTYNVTGIIITYIIIVVRHLSLSFNSHFPHGPGLAGTRMSPFWILLQQRMTEVMVITGSIRFEKLQSNCHLQ